MIEGATERYTNIYLKMTLAAIFWGGLFNVGRVLAQRGLTPLQIGWFRYVVAVAVLLALIYRAEGGLPRLDRRQLLATIGLGIAGVSLYNYFFFGALERIPASRSALLVALNPIFTALAMALAFGERLAPRRWLGVAIGFIGVAIVITRGQLGDAFGGALGVGELMSIAATLLWVVYGLIARFAVIGLSPLAATTYASIWGLLMLTPFYLAEAAPVGFAEFGWVTIGGFLYAGILGTVVPFLWFYQAIHAIGPARTTVFSNLVPMFGVAFGVTLLGEPLTASILIGGALTIAGVMLTNRP